MVMLMFLWSVLIYLTALNGFIHYIYWHLTETVNWQYYSYNIFEKYIQFYFIHRIKKNINCQFI